MNEPTGECLICRRACEPDVTGSFSGGGFGVCPSCLADAALGRAVRKMPPNHGMLLNHNAKLHEDDRRVWAACFGEFGQNYGPFWGDTPEAALRAAGLMEGDE